MPTIISSHKVIQGKEDSYQEALREINDRVRLQPGFIGLETLSPTEGLQDDWAVIFRFADNESMRVWLQSAERNEKLKKVESCLEQPAHIQILADQKKDKAPVAVVFAQKVKPEKKLAFLDWQKRLRQAQEKIPGYLGTEVFEPAEGVQEEWVNIVRFDTPEHLEQWLFSRERGKLLEEAESYVEHYRANKLATGLEGWFDFSNARGEQVAKIPSWKQAILVLVALYPTVMALHYLLTPFLSGLSAPLGMLVTNLISVSLLTWACMPLVSKRIFRFWILKPKDNMGSTAPKVQWAGVLLATSILLLFLMLFQLIGDASIF